MAEKNPNIKLAELIHSCPRLLGYGGLFGSLREDHSRFRLFAAFVNHAIAQKRFSPSYITTANFIAFIRDRELLEEGALNELEKFLEELRHGAKHEIREEDSNRSQNTLYLLANTLGELGVWRNSAQSVSRYEGALENAILSSAGKVNVNANVPEISPVKTGEKVPAAAQTASGGRVILEGGQPASELAIKESGGDLEIVSESTESTATSAAPAKGTSAADGASATDVAPAESAESAESAEKDEKDEISPVKTDEKAPDNGQTETQDTSEDQDGQRDEPAQPDQAADFSLPIDAGAHKHAAKSDITSRPKTPAAAKLSPAQQIEAARILEEGPLGARMPQAAQGTGQMPRRFARVGNLPSQSAPQMRAPVQSSGRRTGRNAQAQDQTQDTLQAQARQQQQQQGQDRPATTQNKKRKSMLGRLGKGAGIAASLGLGGGMLSQATPAAVAATHAHAAGYGILQTILEIIIR